MKLIHVFLLGLSGLVVASCGGSKTEPAEPAEPAKSETVFDPMVETLDKARAVQDLDLEHKRQLDEQLDQN